MTDPQHYREHDTQIDFNFIVVVMQEKGYLKWSIVIISLEANNRVSTILEELAM